MVQLNYSFPTRFPTSQDYVNGSHSIWASLTMVYRNLSTRFHISAFLGRHVQRIRLFDLFTRRMTEIMFDTLKPLYSETPGVNQGVIFNMIFKIKR